MLVPRGRVLNWTILCSLLSYFLVQQNPSWGVQFFKINNYDNDDEYNDDDDDEDDDNASEPGVIPSIWVDISQKISPSLHVCI